MSTKYAFPRGFFKTPPNMANGSIHTEVKDLINGIYING